MKVFVQIAAVCLAAQAVLAAKGPVPEPVCDAKCPDTFPIEDNWHLPYDGDCTKFCHCANDGNWKKDCPPGLYFNAQLQVCDWPENSGCVDGDVPPTEGNPSEEPSEEPSEKPSEEPSEEPSEKPSEEPSEEPSEKPSEEPSEKPIEKPTPKPAPGGCENVACAADDCFVWANTGDCQAYCDCDHGEIILKECADGLHFNPTTGDCDFPENANCVLPTPPPNGCEHVECGEQDCFKTSNSLDCNAYCDCDHGNVAVEHCSEGLHFNSVTGACDFTWNAGCEKPVEKPTEKPADASTEAPTEDPAPAPGRECDNVCPDVWPVVENNHLYPGDCTKFCHCANDGNWLKDCSVGLHFNAKLQVCDWPENAGCVEEPVARRH